MSIDIVNPTSTSVTGQMELSMYLGGFLTAQGTVAIAAVKPVFLGLTAATTSRVVGSSTDLTLNFNRVHPFSA